MSGANLLLFDSIREAVIAIEVECSPAAIALELGGRHHWILTD
jgi:hypothetical protein